LPCYVPGILRIGILPFSPENVERFISALPWSSPSEAQSLIEAIRSDRDLEEMSRTPLLLTLLVIVARFKGVKNIPKRKDNVYRNIVNLMLFEWDERKRIGREYAISDQDIRLRILRKVAFTFHKNGQRSFTLVEFIERVVDAVPDVTLDTADRFTHELLRDCLLCPTGGGRFTFFHFSIQEYLVALELAEDYSPARIHRAVEDHFRGGSWWEETLVFWGGIKRDVSSLVTEMNDHIPTSNRDEAKAKVRRLIERWLEVADLTRWALVNPRGVVALVLAELSVASLSERWLKLATIDQEPRE
jgi:predicted NACHT family NTPase